MCVCTRACLLSWLQLCLTLCYPIDYSPPGFSVGFPGKNTGVDCHALLPRNLPYPRIEPISLKSLALAGRLFTTSATWEGPIVYVCQSKLLASG